MAKIPTYTLTSAQYLNKEFDQIALRREINQVDIDGHGCVLFKCRKRNIYPQMDCTTHTDTFGSYGYVTCSLWKNQYILDLLNGNTYG